MIENNGWRLFVNVVQKNRRLLFGLKAPNRQQWLDNHSLLNHRLKLIVGEVNRIQFAGRVVIDNAAGNFLSVLKIHLAHDVDVFVSNRPGTPSKPLCSFSPHQCKTDRFIGAFVLNMLGSRPDNVCIKGTAKTSIGSDHQQHDFVSITLHQ